MQQWILGRLHARAPITSPLGSLSGILKHHNSAMDSDDSMDIWAEDRSIGSRSRSRSPGRPPSPRHRARPSCHAGNHDVASASATLVAPTVQQSTAAAVTARNKHTPASSSQWALVASSSESECSGIGRDPASTRASLASDGHEESNRRSPSIARSSPSPEPFARQGVFRTTGPAPPPPPRIGCDWWQEFLWQGMLHKRIMLPDVPTRDMTFFGLCDGMAPQFVGASAIIL